MTSTFTSSRPSSSFKDLYAHLQTNPPPLLPPGKPHDAKLTDAISSLYLHPTLEALLHILNADLPSAHFLVRHMQAAPAVEGMYIHGVLHRVEGDYNNCRAWYADVSSTPAFTNFWGDEPSPAPPELTHDAASGHFFTDPSLAHKVPPQAGARAFVSAVEALKTRKQGDEQALAQQSRREIEALVGFCVDKFGTERCVDATTAWVRNDEEHAKMARDMVSGDKGFRKF